MRSELHISALGHFMLIRTGVCACRDANGLAQVIYLSRSFMSSTAKAKTAKLSGLQHLCWLYSVLKI